VSERLTKALKISAAASNPSQVRGRKKRGGLAVLFSSVFFVFFGVKGCNSWERSGTPQV
jgi:hypothetical protein